MTYKFFVRSTKRGSILVKLLFTYPQDLVIFCNSFLDVSVNDIQTFMAKRYVKASSKFGILHLSYKVS